MQDIAKLIIAALLAFLGGLVSGVALEQYRERRRSYNSILAAFLDAFARDRSLESDEWRRFAALQRSGAFTLTKRELERLEKDVCGRGLPDPFAPWREVLPPHVDFPFAFVQWANRRRIDFSDEESSSRSVMTEYAITEVKPPERARITFL